MKRALIFFIIGFVFTTAQAQMDNPLKEGMPNTVTLSTGEVVYDLKGEWDAVYKYPETSIKDVVEITQEDNKFTGINLIGSEYVPKGSDAIKGELEKGGFESVSTFAWNHDWYPSTGEIGEKCNKVVIRTRYSSGGIMCVLTLTRK